MEYLLDLGFTNDDITILNGTVEASVLEKLKIFKTLVKVNYDYIKSLGIKNRLMSSKSDFKKSWEITNNAATLYRLSADNAAATMDNYINTASAANTADYYLNFY